MTSTPTNTFRIFSSSVCPHKWMGTNSNQNTCLPGRVDTVTAANRTFIYLFILFNNYKRSYKNDSKNKTINYHKHRISSFSYIYIHTHNGAAFLCQADGREKCSSVLYLHIFIMSLPSFYIKNKNNINNRHQINQNARCVLTVICHHTYFKPWNVYIFFSILHYLKTVYSKKNGPLEKVKTYLR